MFLWLIKEGHLLWSWRTKAWINFEPTAGFTVPKRDPRVSAYDYVSQALNKYTNYVNKGTAFSLDFFEERPEPPV